MIAAELKRKLQDVPDDYEVMVIEGDTLPATDYFPLSDEESVIVEHDDKRIYLIGAERELELE